MLLKYQAILLSFIVHAVLLFGLFTIYRMENIVVEPKKRCIVSLSEYGSKVCNIESKIEKIVKPIIKKEPKILPKKLPKKVVEKRSIIKPVEKKPPPKKIIKHVVVPKKVVKEPIVEEVIVTPIIEEPIVKNIVKDKEQVIEANIKASKPISSNFVKEKSVEELEIIAPVQTYEESYMEEHLAMIVALLKDNLYYPRIARRRGITGEVLISFELTTSGEVQNVFIISGTHKILNRAAITTLERIYKKFPHPSEHLSLQIPIRYRLR